MPHNDGAHVMSDIPEAGFALALADASLTETGYLGLFQRIEFCLLSLQSR